MSAVSETIVREFFELHGFFLRQHRKYISPARRPDDIDFFILNPRNETDSGELPFVLSPENLHTISKAMVVVKGWHTETFTPAVLENAPEIFRFTTPNAFKKAAEVFGVEAPFSKILVIPALPSGAEAKKESIEYLKSKGVDAILPFWTMLSDLIDRIEVNRNYQKSDLLQIIRILKNYQLFRGHQMELFSEPQKNKTRKTKKPSPDSQEQGGKMKQSRK